MLTLIIWEKKFNNNYYLFDVMWANQSLDLIIIVARFIVMLFSSVGQNKRGQLVTYLFRWRYTMKILIWSNIPRRRRESVIPKHSIHTLAVTDSYTFTTKHPVHPRWSRANSRPHEWKIIQQITAIPGFQLLQFQYLQLLQFQVFKHRWQQRAKLTDCSFKLLFLANY